VDAAGQGVQPVPSDHGRGSRPAASQSDRVSCPECENSVPIVDLFICDHCGQYICRDCLSDALSIATGVWRSLAEVRPPASE